MTRAVWARLARTPPWVSTRIRPKPCKGGTNCRAPLGLWELFYRGRRAALVALLALGWLVFAPLVLLHTAIGKQPDRHGIFSVEVVEIGIHWREKVILKRQIIIIWCEIIIIWCQIMIIMAEWMIIWWQIIKHWCKRIIITHQRIINSCQIMTITHQIMKISHRMIILSRRSGIDWRKLLSVSRESGIRLREQGGIWGGRRFFLPKNLLPTRKIGAAGCVFFPAIGRFFPEYTP